ncbi:uracil/xanthine transporter [Paenibacillus barcinonensis]|uniref:Uracil/xanthine transporter n=1 Tax=Paenibacillus barcinonensis TaxID=198119 RepID=A0A2V4VUC9_PAEBA|nr:uracil/xanthine transporter [Paenibacillus barcinonensis]PYE50621.1 xanthine/uracil permease [Paenibacillus barcinonensis]QKS57315.1 uracil/xanthine transporter [Paenibacillus barcinonensis]
MIHINWLRSGLAGLQWLFFLFTNTVVIPITVGAAFALPQDKIQFLIQCSFVLTGLACAAQAGFGHKRAVMEGQSGLWWGVILSLATAAPSLGISLTELGGSLAVGILISGAITILIGLCGLAKPLSKLFTPGVMAVFMFLLACRLNIIFLEGMLGISSGSSAEDKVIQPLIFLLAAAVAIFVVILSVKARPVIGQYALLIGILGGWVLHTLIFGSTSDASNAGTAGTDWFPLGAPSDGLNAGVVTIAIITGLINTSNTFGALKGTDQLYERETSSNQYKRSFTISGVLAMISGLLGLVPYAPYVSSIGFLQQTRIRDRMPLVTGGLLFAAIGLVPSISNVLTTLPLSIGSAVLFVTYLRLLGSSLQYFGRIDMNAANLYRTAAPLFTGIIVMGLPSDVFVSLPPLLRPLLGNGLLVGILLALLLNQVLSSSPRSRLSPRMNTKGEQP